MEFGYPVTPLFRPPGNLFHWSVEPRWSPSAGLCFEE